jgi:hypothetical protein
MSAEAAACAESGASVVENPGVQGLSVQNPWIPELFHALNQPLTALHCSFELALHQPRSEQEYRNCLLAGLEKAAQASALASGIRELFEAAEPDGKSSTLLLQDQVREAVEHFLPVANDAGTAIILHGKGNFRARFDSDRLRRALFYIFDLILTLARSEVLTIWMKKEADAHHATLEFTCKSHGARSEQRFAEIFGEQPFSIFGDCWKQRLKWMVARQLFRSAGGDLVAKLAGSFHLLARLQLNSSECL